MPITTTATAAAYFALFAAELFSYTVHSLIEYSIELKIEWNKRKKHKVFANNDQQNLWIIKINKNFASIYAKRDLNFINVFPLWAIKMSCSVGGGHFGWWEWKIIRQSINACCFHLPAMICQNFLLRCANLVGVDEDNSNVTFCGGILYHNIKIDTASISLILWLWNLYGHFCFGQIAQYSHLR